MSKIKLTKDEFEDLATAFEGVDGDVQSDYSGRGMWGEECVGYVGPEPHLFVFDLARIIAERNGDGDNVDAVRQAVIDLGEGRSETLGYSTIHYWPMVTVEVDLALIQGGDE